MGGARLLTSQRSGGGGGGGGGGENKTNTRIERMLGRTDMIRDMFRGGITTTLVRTLNVIFAKVPSVGQAIQLHVHSEIIETLTWYLARKDINHSSSSFFLSTSSSSSSLSSSSSSTPSSSSSASLDSFARTFSTPKMLGAGAAGGYSTPRRAAAETPSSASKKSNIFSSFRSSMGFNSDSDSDASFKSSGERNRVNSFWGSGSVTPKSSSISGSLSQASPSAGGRKVSSGAVVDEVRLRAISGANALSASQGSDSKDGGSMPACST